VIRHSDPLLKGASVVTIRPDQTVREALELFAKRNIGALVVVDDVHRAMGMITERGILRSALTNERVLMTEKRIRHLPVMEQGKPVGIVSLGDLVRAQRDLVVGDRQFAKDADPAPRNHDHVA
jgi:CBS domain-containing protein